MAKTKRVRADVHKVSGTSEDAKVRHPLEDFDKLPALALVRIDTVRALHDNCAPVTIWRGVRAGTIPAPMKFAGGMTAWRVGDLRRALAGGAA